MLEFVPPPTPPAQVFSVQTSEHDDSHPAIAPTWLAQSPIQSQPQTQSPDSSISPGNADAPGITIPVPAPETTTVQPITAPSTGDEIPASPSQPLPPTSETLVPVVEVYHPSLSIESQPDLAPAVVPLPIRPAEELGNPIVAGQSQELPASLTPSVPWEATWEYQHVLQHLVIAPEFASESNATLPEQQINSQHFRLPWLEPIKGNLSTSPPNQLLVQDRQGNVQEFEIFPEPSLNSPDGESRPLLTDPDSPSPANQSESSPTPPDARTSSEPLSPEPTVIEVIADEQEYLQQEKIVIARGNAVIRFTRGVLAADIVRINLPNRLAVAEGNVLLERGEQTLRGERFDYYFVQDNGVVYNASGEIYQPSASQDFSPNLPTDDASFLSGQTLDERLAAEQPIQRVTTTGGYEYSLGFSSNPQSGLGEAVDFSGDDRNRALPQGLGREGPFREGSSSINRLRFEAERIDFDADGWHATNVRLTNDPFSPPELELRASTADFRNVAPFVDELVLTNSQVVFDQTTTIPAFQNRLVFDSRPRDSALNVVNFGYDGEERGGLFVERTFPVYTNRQFSLNLTPQYFIQKALVGETFEDFDGVEDESESSILSPNVFGLITEARWELGESSEFQADIELTSFDFSEIEDRLRTRIRFDQEFGPAYAPTGDRHTARLAYNYRERLFNGSLGFQNVQSSVGAILFSPRILLGRSNVEVSYQGSVQSINANTDRLDLLEPERDNNRVRLTRIESAASIGKNFRLWTGRTLPATRDEGLRYTPIPVAPFFDIVTRVTGVTSYYSSGDNQPSLRGIVGFRGQLGNFSRSFWDFTGFQLLYSNSISGDESPFLFDRFVDRETLNFGFTQQLYGPFRFGVQGVVNLETGEEVNTNYYLEYSRRTYNVLLRYNPIQEIGSINFRVNDFNWTGSGDPFEQDRFRPVIQGVTR